MPVPSALDSEVLLKDVNLLASELEKVRISYEQYFLGLEREEPVKAREKLAGLVRKHASTGIQNARLKFRLQQTIARYNSLSAYWNRILREIEEGRYCRDVFRANLHDRERKQPKPQPKKDPMTLLFDHYVEAKKKCQEPVTGLTLDAFKKALMHQVEQFQKNHKAPGLRFQVVTESGKAKIKVVPQTQKK